MLCPGSHSCSSQSQDLTGRGLENKTAPSLQGILLYSLCVIPSECHRARVFFKDCTFPWCSPVHCSGNWDGQEPDHRVRKKTKLTRVLQSKDRPGKQRAQEQHSLRTFLVVQRLRLCAPNAGDPGSIPSERIRSRIPQLRPSVAK